MRKYKNLFYVGAGTHPGAGVPGVINSAKAVEKISIPMNNYAKVMQEHGKTFFWASWFLDKNTANKLFAVYALCRRLDDLVDTSNRNY